MLVTEGIRRQRFDDLNSVGELYSKDDFRQLVIAIETPPAFFGGLSELEDHRQRGLVRETSLGSHGPVAHRRARAFDDIGCTQMLPVFGRKVIEGKQCVSILDQTLGCPVVLDAPGFDEGIKCEQICKHLPPMSCPPACGSSRSARPTGSTSWPRSSRWCT